jgi:hypothetical protein
MNKKALTAVIVILVLIVGVYGAYRVYKHFKRISAPAAQTQTTATQSGAPSTTLGSLKDLMLKGIPQTCTYKSDKSQGTLYMDGGKVRGDISTDVEVDGKTTESHIIIADKAIYMWSDGRNVGYKMVYDPNATPAPAGTKTTNASGALDPNTQMNYSCSAWIADSSKFTLPTNVTFSSLSIPSQTTGAPTTGGNASQCSYCNNLTGDEKTQCLTALKCN